LGSRFLFIGGVLGGFSMQLEYPSLYFFALAR
jgi:hypothetical protein